MQPLRRATLVPFFADMPLSEITTVDVARWLHDYSAVRPGGAEQRSQIDLFASSPLGASIWCHIQPVVVAAFSVSAAIRTSCLASTFKTNIDNPMVRSVWVRVARSGDQNRAGDERYSRAAQD
ncbi:MAG: hypothetical protein OET79_17105 [Nitrospirota bacterium]|nr:hypothetical protein [Nitrospirota bacterium]